MVAVSLKTAREAISQQLPGEVLLGIHWYLTSVLSVVEMVQLLLHDQLHRC